MRLDPSWTAGTRDVARDVFDSRSSTSVDVDRPSSWAALLSIPDSDLSHLRTPWETDCVRSGRESGRPSGVSSRPGGAPTAWCDKITPIVVYADLWFSFVRRRTHHKAVAVMSVLDQVINKAQATIPMERQVQGLHMFQKAKRLVLGDKQPIFVEKTIPDVDQLALTEIDLSNPFLYGRDSGTPTSSGCGTKRRCTIKPTVPSDRSGRSPGTTTSSPSTRTSRCSRPSRRSSSGPRRTVWTSRCSSLWTRRATTSSARRSRASWLRRTSRRWRG